MNDLRVRENLVAFLKERRNFREVSRAVVKRQTNRQNQPRVKHFVAVFVGLYAGAFLNAADAERGNLRRNDFQHRHRAFLCAVNGTDVGNGHGALFNVAIGQTVAFGNGIIFLLRLAVQGFYLVFAGFRANQAVNHRSNLAVLQRLNGVVHRNFKHCFGKVGVLRAAGDVRNVFGHLSERLVFKIVQVNRHHFAVG